MRKRMMAVAVAWVFFVAPASVGAEGQPDESSGADDEGSESWTVAVIADLNGPYGSMEYNEHVEAAVAWIRDDLQPDLVVTAGDHIAGQQEGLDYAQMWSVFHDEITDELAAADIPLAVTPGNHDASEHSTYWRERVEFARQFEARRPRLQFIDDSMYPFYYAFEMGPALFVGLDGTGVGDLDDAQIDWLESVLSANSHLEVSVLFSHVPQYPVAEGRQHEIVDDRRLARLKSEHSVDLMISGHHHAYFPARIGDTYLLHAQALGSGTRALIGEEQPRPRNVAVFEYDRDGIVSIEAYESPEFSERVDLEGLPETLEYEDYRLHRMDR